MPRKKKNQGESSKMSKSDSLSLRTRRRVILSFPPSVLQTPITYILAKEYDIASNILRAEILPEESGKLVIEMDGLPENLDKAIQRIKEFDIDVTEIARKVTFDMDKCIHCGACVSVCLAGALKLDKNFHLEFIEPKCTVCEMCVTTCPVDVVNIDI
ncbi:MAG: 4Fe-4S dicluster domain-containing protein [Candidatus Melainabacteria bacterium]|nr:4Fe-4S dicluster domain-containing protein [Candidatus Melainabacteria bacterium]MBI3308793.1 4Fe-4S dicluster domain-containing protein [Candidatus Melainabacteria bacterium]